MAVDFAMWYINLRDSKTTKWFLYPESKLAKFSCVLLLRDIKNRFSLITVAGRASGCFSRSIFLSFFLFLVYFMRIPRFALVMYINTFLGNFQRAFNGAYFSLHHRNGNNPVIYFFYCNEICLFIFSYFAYKIL